MDTIYQAIRVIAVYLLLCSLLLGILPDSPLKQYVRLFAGLFLILLLLRSFFGSFLPTSFDMEEFNTGNFYEQLLDVEKTGEERLKEEILQQMQ